MKVLIVFILIVFLFWYIYDQIRQKEIEKVLKYSIENINKQELNNQNFKNPELIKASTWTLDEDIVSNTWIIDTDKNIWNDKQNKALDHNSLYLYKWYYGYLDKVDDDIKNNFIFRWDTEEKKISITFDDWPLLNTKNIIDYLNKNQIPATFFIICSRLNDVNSDYYSSDFISVWIHSYNHTNFQNSTKDYIKEDIKKCKNIFSNHSLETRYFRPPYWIITKNLSESLNDESLKWIIWSIDSLDWNWYKKESLYNQIIPNLSWGDIILFHDMISVSDLKNIVDWIKNSWYEIVSLKELLN